MEWIKENNPHYVEQIIQMEEERKKIEAEGEGEILQMSNLEKMRYKNSSDSPGLSKNKFEGLDNEEEEKVDDTKKDKKEDTISFNKGKT